MILRRSREGVPGHRIAEELGVTRQAVSARLRRIIRVLRRTIEDLRASDQRELAEVRRTWRAR